MEDKKAASTIIGMLKKYPFDTEEKEALSEAVGVLSWTALGESRMKKMKNKRDDKIRKDLNV